MAGESAGEQLAGFGRDLLTLEINTILKEHMTGEKMPAVRHALIGLALEYLTELGRLGAHPCPIPSVEIVGAPTRADIEKLNEQFRSSNVLEARGSWEAFDYYREAADAMLKAFLFMAPSERERIKDLQAKEFMLTRIKDNSDQIKGVLRRARDDNHFSREELEQGVATASRKERTKAMEGSPDHVPLKKGDRPPALLLVPDDLMLVRKAWEIGTETVYSQTVIQLDGDVITRVAPSKAAEKALLELHRINVDVSVSFWKTLVGIVSDSLGALLDRVAGKRP